MANVVLKLRKNKKLKDNKYPYIVYVTSQGDEKIITIDSATEDQFDKKTGYLKPNHPNYIKSNRTAMRIFSEIQDKIYEAMLTNTILSVDDLISDKSPQESKVVHDFFQVAEVKRQAYLKEGKQGTYLQWGGVVGKLKKYCKDNPLPLSDITVEFVQEYKTYLEGPSMKNKKNTIWSNFKVLKAVYNEAIKQGLIAGVNPFTQVETKTEPPMKDRFTMEEFRLFEGCQTTPGTIQHLAQKTFVFAFYCWGMRFRDVALLTSDSIKGKTLTYLTSKSNFTKRITLTMNDTCLSIINLFKDNGTPYLFPLLKENLRNPEFNDIVTQSNHLIKYEHAIASINESVNKALKQIVIRAKVGKDVSFHTARHSFVDILKKKKIPIEVRMQLVGHSSEAVHKRYHGDFDQEEMSELVNSSLSL